jgi:hypothetical protein
MGMEKSNFYSTNEERENMLGQGSFDKLEVPASFQGTYRELFEVLLISFGAIAIGLNRYVKLTCVRCVCFAHQLVYVDDWL